MNVGLHIERLRALAEPRATERGLDVDVVIDEGTRALRVEFGRDGHVTCWTELDVDDLDARMAQDADADRPAVYDAAALVQIDIALCMRLGPRPS